MKFMLSFVIVLSANAVFSQSRTEADVLNLSDKIFSWEVENKIDLFEAVLSDKFKVVNSRGDIQNGQQYLTVLRSETVQHDSIAVEQRTVTIVDKTAIVIGKGWFHMTVSGNKLHRHLSYMEVFARDSKDWKLLALYATDLPE
jgi:hypothetical protein